MLLRVPVKICTPSLILFRAPRGELHALNTVLPGWAGPRVLGNSRGCWQSWGDGARQTHEAFGVALQPLSSYRRLIKKDAEQLLAQSDTDRTRGNGFKLNEERGRFGVRRQFLPQRVARPRRPHPRGSSGPGRALPRPLPRLRASAAGHRTGASAPPGRLEPARPAPEKRI